MIVYLSVIQVKMVFCEKTHCATHHSDSGGIAEVLMYSSDFITQNIKKVCIQG